jgi:paraquat-inducible protein B
MSDFLKDVDVAQPVAPSKPRRPSFIWLIPLLALAISAAVVWNNYASRGPLITVTFKSAAGINPGTTELRIRDLRIGVVEAVNFSGNMATVEAHIRLDKSIAPYVDKDAQFWLVEPEVTARGVTGIGTLLSGVYIAANWDGSQGEAVERFVALETAPLRLFGEEGTRIVLQARSGNQFAAGAPILASGIDVGRIGLATLSHSGNAVTRMEAATSGSLPASNASARASPSPEKTLNTCPSAIARPPVTAVSNVAGWKRQRTGTWHDRTLQGHQGRRGRRFRRRCRR